MPRPNHKWHTPHRDWRSRYDQAWKKIRNKLGSYDKIAALLFRETDESVVGQTIRRWHKNGNLPVNWGTSLIDLMDGEINLFDLYPYLSEYVEEDFLE